MLNPPVAIATATAMPNTPTSARPGYLINIRMPSFTSNHQESSAGKDRADRKTESRRRKRGRIVLILIRRNGPDSAFLSVASLSITYGAVDYCIRIRQFERPRWRCYTRRRLVQSEAAHEIRFGWHARNCDYLSFGASVRDSADRSAEECDRDGVCEDS